MTDLEERQAAQIIEMHRALVDARTTVGELERHLLDARSVGAVAQRNVLDLSTQLAETSRDALVPVPGVYRSDQGAPPPPSLLIPGYASVGDLAAWAWDIRQSRSPDFIIGDDYMRRWWLIPRNELCNVYLHEILHSDDDRALHDHPWTNTSMVLEGGYLEHTPDGSHWRGPGDVVTRKATDAHRLEVPEGGSAVTLFFTGPKVREWGFLCPQGWRLWSDFVDTRDTGQIGRGCGE